MCERFRRWIALTAILTLSLSHPAFANNFTEILKLSEPRYKLADVPVEFNLPKQKEGPFPVVISIHGSTQDGKKFIGGKGQTDTYTTRLVSAANKRGFAVLAIDAFYLKDIKPNQKRIFPQANRYGRELRDRLINYPELDRNKVFFTGFSYGGHSVLRELFSAFSIENWTGIAAIEPDCNMFAAPSQVSTPILIIKGSESHYPPKPCEIMANLYNDKGSNMRVEIVPKSNHHFSRNGKTVRGVAFNGCSEDPILVFGRDDFQSASGKKIPASEIREGKCFTEQSGAGKTWDDLDLVINSTLDFFETTLAAEIQ